MMWLLIRHDSGTDGWDASSGPVAVFSSHDRVMVELGCAGYTVEEHGSFFHQDNAKRYTMNAISYSVREIPFNEWKF